MTLVVMRLEPDGTPDETFGDHGVSQVSITDRKPQGGKGTALALQPDGRILIAGVSVGVGPDFVVARLLADGTPDTEFTDTGTMIIDFPAAATRRGHRRHR